MTFDLKSLELTGSYKFDVTVVSDSEKFAGKICLSPEKSTITIMGEMSQGRECSIGFGEIERMVCYDLNKTFILHNLHCIYFSNRTIERYPKSIGFFEYKFEVEFVIFSPVRFEGIDCISSLSIHSDSIGEWVGFTENQEKILELYHKRMPVFSYPAIHEFMVEVNNKNILGVDYIFEIEGGGCNKFKAGITYSPILYMTFHERLSTVDLKDKYLSIYNLMSFFYGDDVVVDRIDIGIEIYNQREKGSLYFSSKSIWPKYPRDYPFYPLGKGLKYNYIECSPIPLTSFYEYFHLPNKELGYFGKYIKYKRMDNVEERYLGFFRLLEALCFQKKKYLDEDKLLDICSEYKDTLIEKFRDRKSVTSFLKRIPKLNESKYNTEKCIQEFYNLIPETLRNTWIYGKSDIGVMCVLRNDITHANDYYIDEKEIGKKTKFIEVLLIIVLLSKIGILPQQCEKLIDRVSGYHCIEQNR